jgi:predicted enzyme related to lactoylglutathione lyase
MAKPKKKSKPAFAHSLCWFEIPADDVDRAKSFYGKLFGWKVKEVPGMTGYWHIDTGGADSSLDGGLMARKHPQQPPINYVLVPSVKKFIEKVTKLGGKICMPKTEIPGMGHFAICEDTEHNQFAIWEMISKKK